jgi:Glycosyltransferase sugar-binding region containing DXD motif
MPVVPRILHQIWFNFSCWGDVQAPPARYAALTESWRKLNPGWRRILWNEHSAEQLMQRFYPRWLDRFRSLPEPIQRADLFRWVALYHFGGCYADLDTRCSRAIDAALDDALDAPFDAALDTALETAHPRCWRRAPVGEPQVAGQDEHVLALPASVWAANALLVSSRRNPAARIVLESLGRPWLRRSVVGTFFSTGPARVRFAVWGLERAGHRILRDPLLLDHQPAEPSRARPGVLAIHEGHGAWGVRSCVRTDLVRLVAAILLTVMLVMLLASRRSS